MNKLRICLRTALVTALMGVLIFAGKALAETRYEITLNHETPEITQGFGYRYIPVIEEVFVITPHVIMTQNVEAGHFPDDAVISGTAIEVWFYMVDWNNGIKVFLVEEALEVSENLPEWIAYLYPLVAEELVKDGGVEYKISSLKKDKDFLNEPEEEVSVPMIPVWKMEL